MVQDDRFFQYRLRLFARAGEVGVSQACRELGYHRSWYYRWKPLVERHGLEILRPRERRRPRMPNQVPPWLEERVIAFAWAIRAWGHGGSPPNWPSPDGAVCSSPLPAYSMFCTATGWAPGSCG